MASTNDTFITLQTKKRIINDISYLYKNPLNNQGIFYIHDDLDMLKGYAMIIGPKDTPYENGFYFFEFIFPSDYPLNPPKLNFLNKHEQIRFNPNLYRNGKVCLSILNTWKGEGWTSCQTISSVLLTLVTILNEKPLLNEPGIKEHHRDFINYNLCIQYENFNYSIADILLRKQNFLVPFIRFAEEHTLKNKENILKKVQDLSIKYQEVKKIYIDLYSMPCTVNYVKLFEKINHMFIKLESSNN